MRLFLTIIGLGWAAVGAANIGFGFDVDRDGSGFVMFLLVMNTVLFVLPGLVLAGLAHLADKPDETPLPPGQ